LPEYDAEHRGDHIDGEEIICLFGQPERSNGATQFHRGLLYICEETDSSYNNGANMIPAEGSLVDLGERKASALIGVCDMCLELVSAGVGSRCACAWNSHSHYESCGTRRSLRRFW
jgi:hypothetical protein